MRPERDNRRIGAFLLALLLCGLLTVLHARADRRGAADPISGTVRDVALVPGQTVAAQTGQWWQLNLGSLFAGPRLARENARLKQQARALSAQNRDLRDAQTENMRLRRLLGFQQRTTRPLLAAQVIALKPNAHADTLTVNRGIRAGVHLHSVVLSPTGGLVGQVISVTPGSADVLLLTDVQSSVGALVKNNATQEPIGLCQGDGNGHLRVTYLRSDTQLHPGDAVTTSGLGGVFPKALPLGTIASISVDKTRSLQTALLRPAADYDHLQEAFVIQDAPSEE